MSRAEIESRALRAVDRAKRGQPLEDSSIEFKREWIDPTRGARRLAGHANAAGSDLLQILAPLSRTPEVEITGIGLGREVSSETIRASSTELLIEGPGLVKCSAERRGDAYGLGSQMRPRVEGEIPFSLGSAMHSVSLTCEYLESQEGLWKWRVLPES
jgi:hypothetical protein